jgi:hypothetical protein
MEEVEETKKQQLIHSNPTTLDDQCCHYNRLP